MNFKKFLISSLFLSGLILSISTLKPHKILALDYTETVSTSAVTGSTTSFADNGAPAISGGVLMDKLVIANLDTSAYIEVSVYDTCDSTTNATLAGSFVVSPSTQGSPGTLQIDFPENNPWRLTNPGFVLTGTLNKAKITTFYR